MFGIILPPGVDIVRIMAHTGKQGKRPCLWEGHPTTPQHEIESAIDSDLRVRRWLSKQRLIKDGTATMTLSLELFSQGQRVETIEVKDVSLFIRYAKKKPRTTSDEVVVKSLSVLDSTNKNLIEQLEKNWKSLTEQLSERDTVIGMLVQRGLNPPQPPQPPKQEVQTPTDTLSTLLDNGSKIMQMLNAFKSMRESN